jgi:hypothetical protein
VDTGIINHHQSDFLAGADKLVEAVNEEGGMNTLGGPISPQLIMLAGRPRLNKSKYGLSGAALSE